MTLKCKTHELKLYFIPNRFKDNSVVLIEWVFRFCIFFAGGYGWRGQLGKPIYIGILKITKKEIIMLWLLLFGVFAFIGALSNGSRGSQSLSSEKSHLSMSESLGQSNGFQEGFIELQNINSSTGYSESFSGSGFDVSGEFMS